MVSLVVSCTMLSGCYQRVVGVRGMGGYGVAVQEPYRSETALDRAVDRWVGGEPEEKPRTRAAVPLPEKKRRESSSW